MRRAAVIVPAALLLAVLAWAGAPAGPGRTCAQAAGSAHVAVVVEHGGGQVLAACVGFVGGSLTGAQVMDASGIEYATSGYGGGLGNAVCQVDHEPTTYPPGCWTGGSRYWSLFVSRAGGSWTPSDRGLSSQTFAAGDALGWHYVPQSGPGGGPPPSPAGVCPEPVTPTSSPIGAATGPGPATPAGPGSVPPPGTSQVSPATPDLAVVTTPGPTGIRPARAQPSRPALTAAPAPGLNLGWLVAAIVGGALGGLLIVQVLSRRTRR